MQNVRRRGACLRCFRRKRKCDHKYPQCSRCIEHGEVCQPRNFKSSTLEFNPDSRSNASPLLTELRPEVPTLGSPPCHNPPDDSDNISAMSPPLRNGEPPFPLPDFTAGTILGAESANLDELFTLTSSQSHHTGELCQGFQPNNLHAPFQLDLEGALDLGSESSIPAAAQYCAKESCGLVPETAVTRTLPNLRAQSSFTDLLYCPMPWPDDMARSAEKRFLWQYFLNTVEVDFLCLDWEEVSHLNGFQHPYVTTLPQMALSNEAARGAIFCFAASQFQRRQNQAEFTKIRASTSAEATRSLRYQISQKAEDDTSLLGMVCAATLLQHFSAERHDYLKIASGLVSTFLRRNAQQRRTWFSSFSHVLLTEFRWSVIATLCSLQVSRSNIDDRLCRMIEMDTAEIEQKYSEGFQTWITHPIYTFSPRLVNPLLRIGRLLEKQLLQMAAVPAEIDEDWDFLVTQAEEMLLQAREQDIEASTYACTDPAAVLSLNESMYAASAILLYSRLRGLPFTAPFIRRQARIVVEQVSEIPVQSRVSYAIIFPLFVAGCEAVETDTREAIKSRLINPQGIQFNRGDLVGTLEKIWEIRDLNPGLIWPKWASKVQTDQGISSLM